MAQDSLTIGGNFPLTFSISDSGGSSKSGRFGVGSLWPSLAVDIEWGTGSGQCNLACVTRRTLTATTYDNLDLAGGLSDNLGNTLTFTKIKLAILALATPDGTANLRVGPQAQSNVMQGPWGGTGATVYKTVYHSDIIWRELVAGFTVTAGTGDIFPIYNPTGSSVIYTLLLAGLS